MLAAIFRMKDFLVIGLILWAFGCCGQILITGTVTDQNGDTLPFVNILLLDNNTVVSGSTTDFDGRFVINHQNHTDNMKIVGLYFGCRTDTIKIKAENMINLQMTLNFSDSCRSKIELPNCRHNYIMKGAYYVDISDSTNDQLKIVTGDQILTKKSYSPYDYQVILPDKKYRNDNGKIYKGQALIEMDKLPLKNWDYAGFEPVRDE